MIKNLCDSIKVMLFSKHMYIKLNCSLNLFVNYMTGMLDDNYSFQKISSTFDTFEFKINKKLFLWRNSFNPIIHCKAVDGGNYIYLDICCGYPIAVKIVLFIMSMFFMLLFVIDLACFGVSVFMVIFFSVYICFVLSLNLHGYSTAKRIIIDVMNT